MKIGLRRTSRKVTNSSGRASILSLDKLNRPQTYRTHFYDEIKHMEKNVDK